MDTLALLMRGVDCALTPINLMWVRIGSIWGTAIGILPGIGPALTIALLLPVTVSVGPVSAFIMFAGVLYGAMYGGSATSILINTPGEAGAMMTALEGNKMERAGRGEGGGATGGIGWVFAGTITKLVRVFGGAGGGGMG